MFGLFSKKTPLSVEVVPPQKSMSNMTLLLVLQMEKYIQENKRLFEVQKEETRQLEIAYRELVAVGLENSKNARLIKQKIDAVTPYNESIEKAGELLVFIRDLRSHFGDKTLLIGSTQFKEICKKYNLVTGPISQYTGIIPNSNLRDLQVAIRNAKTFPYRTNVSKNHNTMWYFNEIETSSSVSDDDEVEVARRWINSKGGMVFANASSLHSFDGTVNLRDIVRCNDDIPQELAEYHYDNLIRFKGVPIQRDTMFIACPPSQLKEQSLKVTTNRLDPIIFQYSDYGIMIHTMWGEEAEDAVFEEYKRINNLISL